MSAYSVVPFDVNGNLYLRYLPMGKKSLAEAFSFAGDVQVPDHFVNADTFTGMRELHDLGDQLNLDVYVVTGPSADEATWLYDPRRIHDRRSLLLWMGRYPGQYDLLLGGDYQPILEPRQVRALGVRLRQRKNY